MLNTKVIVLSGFSRGGTNIAWNLLQSHPQVCSPIYETGELFRRSWVLRLCRLLAGRNRKCIHTIDDKLFKAKMLTMGHLDNKYIADGELYTHEKVSNAALNLKSVNDDIFLTKLLLKVYPDMYFIALARNGYALCDGHMRRGGTAAEAGKLYYRISEEMKRNADTIPRFKLIRFEDILERPFDAAEELFKFIDVQPLQLDKLRFKSKKIINKHGNHKVKFGNENRKYWFDKDCIGQILYPNVNQAQVDRLSGKVIREFNLEAEPALKYFGYEVY